MAKELLRLSYRIQWGALDKHTIFIVAKSKKQIIEMLAPLGVHVTQTEIKNHFLMWGNAGEHLKNVDTSVPCVYAMKHNGYNVQPETLRKLV